MKEVLSEHGEWVQVGFKTISESDVVVFNRKVSNYIKKGWVLHGNTITDLIGKKSKKTIIYTQALVKSKNVIEELARNQALKDGLVSEIERVILVMMVSTEFPYNEETVDSIYSLAFKNKREKDVKRILGCFLTGSNYGAVDSNKLVGYLKKMDINFLNETLKGLSNIIKPSN